MFKMWDKLSVWHIFVSVICVGYAKCVIYAKCVGFSKCVIYDQWAIYYKLVICAKCVILWPVSKICSGCGIN